MCWKSETWEVELQLPELHAQSTQGTLKSRVLTSRDPATRQQIKQKCQSTDGWTEGAQRSPRRAENENMSLRQIFDDVWRTSSAAGQRLSFADLEAATYKRHRRAQPVLPTSSGEADFEVVMHS